MADNPAKDPAGDQKVGPKSGMMTGKKKWYVIGGLGLLAVLVFFFVSRSNTNAAGGTTTTSGTSLDPATQAALESALQGQAGSQDIQGPAGATGATGPAGAKGATGKTGKTGKTGGTGKTGSPGKPVSAGKSEFYTVKPGNTLSGIASQFGIKGGWQQLYSMNRGVVGSNPNVIHPGQRLKI